MITDPVITLHGSVITIQKEDAVMNRAVSLMAVSALALTVACKQQSLTTESKPPPAGVG